MKYKNLFFDLDDTLWAFSLNARNTFEEIYHKYQFNRYFDSFHHFYSIYQDINVKLWAEYGDGKITKQVADEGLMLLDVDSLGLDRVDRTVLLTMIDKFSGGPVGLDTLAASTGEDALTIEDVYEPYLLQLGFIHRTPRGRVATSFAYAHLNRPFPGGASNEESSQQVGLFDENP